MHNTNKMKVSELQEIIRAAIKEAVNEADISSAENSVADLSLIQTNMPETMRGYCTEQEWSMAQQKLQKCKCLLQ